MFWVFGGLFVLEAEFWINSGSAAEGTFGRRTYLWRPAFGCRSLPPKVDFRLWRGVSAAKGAAEHA